MQRPFGADLLLTFVRIGAKTGRTTAESGQTSGKQGKNGGAKARKTAQIGDFDGKIGQNQANQAKKGQKERFGKNLPVCRADCAKCTKIELVPQRYEKTA